MRVIEPKLFLYKLLSFVLIALIVYSLIGSYWLRPLGKEKGPYLTWSEDPQTTMTVSWEWSSPSPGYVLCWNDTWSIVVNSTENTRVHSVVIRNLSPDTLYHYVVGKYEYNRAKNWSKIAWFRTAPNTTKPFSFIIHSDTQFHPSGLGGHEGIVRAYSRENYEFIINVGDLVEMDNRPEMWQQFFDIIHEVAMFHPYMSAIGNHEEYEYGSTGENYLRYWALPGAELYYSWNYSNVRFIAMNISNPVYLDVPEWQKEWLANEIDSARAAGQWVIVYFHIPPTDLYPVPWIWPENGNTLLGVLDNHPPDLVVCGHFHVYVRWERENTTYVALGSSGGLPAPFVELPNNTKAYHFAMGYGYVRVSGNTLSFEWKGIDGSVIDSFTLKR